MRIAMIGTGYVGLVSGTCFADFGFQVTCVDKDDRKISALRAGIMPIYEPGLDALVESNIRLGRLSFTTDVATAIADADIVFIAVGTPSRRGDGYADLSYVYAAVKEVAASIRNGAVIVVKSTVPVGTGDEVERIVRQVRPGIDISVVSNPEFLREGDAIADFKMPDRVIIGVENETAREKMQILYRPLSGDGTAIFMTTRRSAELIKYAANAFLATKITFINEIADLCERVGADVQDVAHGMGTDNRIGQKFLQAGPGYGGSCFPKDTLALLKTAQSADSPMRVLEAVVAVNDCRKAAMARKVIRAMGGDVRGKKIAILGLTFKPNTDDMRDSPSIPLIQGLQDSGAVVHVFDPEGMEQARQHLSGVIYADDPYTCAADAFAAVIVTEWDAFRAMDLGRLGGLMAERVLVDLRNLYSLPAAADAGFSYQGIGKALIEHGFSAAMVPSDHMVMAPADSMART